MAVGVFVTFWTVPDVAVGIEALRVAEIRVRDASRLGCPVGSDEASQAAGVVTSAHLIQARFPVAFFAGKFVVIRIGVGELEFAAPGVIVRFGFDVACGIGDDRSSLQMVGEVVKDAASAGRSVAAGHALAVEEDVFRFQRSSQITLGHDPRRHIPIERSR